MATRYQCPCCNYYTLVESASYNICPICNWEDDGTIDLSKHSGPNHTTLERGRQNFLDHCDMYELEHRIRDFPSWYERRNELRHAIMKALSNSEADDGAEFEGILDQYYEELEHYLDRRSSLMDIYREFIDRIDTGEQKAVVNGLLGLIFNCEDMEFAQYQCFLQVENEDDNVRGIAVLCFGHLARIHGRITTEWVIPYIKKALKDDSGFVRGHAISALDDIEMFCK